MSIEVNDELVQHMANPNNYGSLEEPDAIGIGENPENGEKVIIYLKVDESDGAERIEEIRFQAIACMTTVVAGSIITKEAENLSFENAEDLIAVTLGMLENVPPDQAACSEMVVVALRAAMDTYRAKKENPEIPAIIYKIEQSCNPEAADPHMKEREEQEG
jgi:nitrogen fixation NifU-like protein